MTSPISYKVCHRFTMIAITLLLSAVSTLSVTAQSPNLVIESHVLPFDFSSKTKKIELKPLDAAPKVWSLCVLVPHMKDEYWISVQSGFKDRADELGIAFEWHEAGGYLQQDRQIQQIRDCVSEGHDAVILGAVSADAPELLKAVEQAASSIPIIAFVNELRSDALSAKVAVSWRRMGEMLGRQVVAELPNDSASSFRVSLVSGPSESGWAPILEAGLREGLKSDRIRFEQALGADSDYRNQFVQVEKAVADCSNNHIIIGSAPAAEAAMSLVRLIACPSQPKIYSTYYSLAVKRGLRSGRIKAAIVDYPVLQGWLAVEQSIKFLEGKLTYKQVGPKIDITTPDNLPEDRWAVITR